jgi:hypothetical protein
MVCQRSCCSINTGLNWPLISSRTGALNHCDRNSEFPGRTVCFAIAIFLFHICSYSQRKEKNVTVGKVLTCRSSQRLGDHKERLRSSFCCRMAGNTMLLWNFISYLFVVARFSLCNASWTGTTEKCTPLRQIAHCILVKGNSGVNLNFLCGWIPVFLAPFSNMSTVTQLKRKVVGDTRVSTSWGIVRPMAKPKFWSRCCFFFCVEKPS